MIVGRQPDSGAEMCLYNMNICRVHKTLSGTPVNDIGYQAHFNLRGVDSKLRANKASSHLLEYFRPLFLMLVVINHPLVVESL